MNIIISLIDVLIPVLFFAILAGALFTAIKANLLVRLLLYFFTIGIVGWGSFNFGMSLTKRTEHMQIAAKYEQSYKVIISHLSELLHEERYDAAREVVNELKKEQISFTSHLNIHQMISNHHSQIESPIIHQQQDE